MYFMGDVKTKSEHKRSTKMNEIYYMDDPELLVLSIMKKNKEISVKNIKYLTSYFTFDVDLVLNSLVQNGDIFEVKEGRYVIL